MPGNYVDQPNIWSVYQRILESQRAEPVSYLNAEPEAFRFTVTAYPGPADISLPVQMGLVVEFLAR
jgi:ribosomal protein S4